MYGRSIRSAVAALMSVLAVASPVGATAGAPRSPVPLPFGGFTSPDVEWIKNVPIHGEATYPHVSYLIDDYLYIDGLQQFTTVDVSNPIEPRVVSQIQRPGPGPWPSDVGYYHDIGRGVTNGKVVVIPAGHRDYFTTPEPRALHVYDISDKANPKQIAELVVDETLQGLFCVLKCKWLYDRTGAIIDLRDPERPRLTDSNWKGAITLNNEPIRQNYHAQEMVEVAPGRILTGSVPMLLLDARKDPQHPRVLARSDGTPLSFGDVAWPRFGDSDIVLSSDPSTNFPMCDDPRATQGTFLDQGFVTWDASRWKTLGMMTPMYRYAPRNGSYVDGDPPTSLDWWGGACTINRFEVHPRFGSNGGLVAAGAFVHGLKLLRVGANGKIKVAGWFLPYAHAMTGIAFFISDRIVYAIDYHRGIDILRYTGRI